MIEFLQQHGAILLAMAGMLGLVVGSFLNVVIYRLPIMMERDWRAQCHEFLGGEDHLPPTPSPESNRPLSLLLPASHCPHCHHPIRPHENIPILSYLMLRGRCSACQAHISARYPVVEATTALFTVFVIGQFGLTGPGIAALLLTWPLIALSLIDFDHQLLPDSITLPFLWLGLLLSLSGIFTDPPSAIIGAVAGYLCLWGVYQLFKRLTGKEGMGYGDFKLLGMFGAWLGWQAIPQIVILASLVGAIVGVSLIVVRGRDRNLPIPFGPYLAAAGWLSLMWGHDINRAYLTWSGLTP